MKNHALTSITTALHRMNGNPVAIRENDSTFLSNISGMLKCEDDFEAQEYAKTKLPETLCAAYGLNRQGADKPFAYSNGLAIIPIHGTLINRYGGYYYGYVTGYNWIRSQMNAALADPEVTGIIFDVNSNGGEAAGCFELADEVFAARGEKPSIAVVDSNCYSAAYALASSASKIAVTPTGGAGSIGVISMHVDMSKMLEERGVKVTIIKSGEHKADGNPYEELSADVKKEWQTRVDTLRGGFVSAVARNRAMDEKTVYDTEARCYSATEALNLGLIDVVSTPANAISDFANGENTSNDAQGSTSMEKYTQEQMDAAKAEAAASATTAATTAERTRISGIIGCDAAKTRPVLASHIAFTTDMSVEAASGMLAMAGEESKPEAAAPTAPAADKPQDNANAGNSPFQAAMNQAQHPEAGNDNGNEQSTEAGTEGGLMAAASAVLGTGFAS